MSSNRFSRLLLVVSAIVLAAGVVGGVPVSGDIAGVEGDVPESAMQGDEVTATFTLNQTALYDRYNEWTLRGETELTNVTWTVVGESVDGNINVDETYPKQGNDGTSFEHSIDSEQAVAQIEVTVRGTVPVVTEFNYSPAQTLMIADFTQVRGSNTRPLGTFTTRPYTNESDVARNTIERAQEAVNGSNNADARDTLGDAISFYNGGQFDEAIDAAERAENTAKQSRQQSQFVQTALYAIVALVGIGGIAGGVWWYRKNQRASRL